MLSLKMVNAYPTKQPDQIHKTIMITCIIRTGLKEVRKTSEKGTNNFVSDFIVVRVKAFQKSTN